MTADQTEVQPIGVETGVVNVNLIAQNHSFNTDRITVSPGARVNIDFENRDEGAEHNFALYESETLEDPIFIGEIVTGPGSITYTFDAPAVRSVYLFRCDTHPTEMRGKFIVE